MTKNLLLLLTFCLPVRSWESWEFLGTWLVFSGIFNTEHHSTLYSMLDMFLVFWDNFVESNSLRQRKTELRWNVKNIMHPWVNTEDLRNGQRGMMRTHSSPQGVDSTWTASRPAGLLLALLWDGLLFVSISPTLSPHVSVSEIPPNISRALLLPLPCPGMSLLPLSWRPFHSSELVQNLLPPQSIQQAHTGWCWAALATKAFFEPLILVCRYSWPDVLPESESHSLPGETPECLGADYI